MKEIVSLLSIAALVTLTACQSSRPVTSVFAVGGVATKIGIVQDPATGQYSLGAQRGQAVFARIPIVYSTNDVGGITAVVPDTIISYEVNAHSGIWGNAQSTWTLATGTNAVQTLLGGQHLPINTATGTGSVIQAQSPNVITNPITGAPVINPLK